jgi:hypothetical protein
MKLWQIAASCLTVFIILFSGCEETFIAPSEGDFDYFPMAVGNYVIYDLDSLFYDDFNGVVRERSLLVRESVESIFIDAAGTESFRILREYRDLPTEVWGAAGFDVWSAKYNGNNVERVEQNQRYIKLVTPPVLGKTWDGNIYINVDPDGPLGFLEDWIYEITSLDEPSTINDVLYDSTLTVVQQNEGTAIDTVGSKEIYAKGIGLIFKELWSLKTQCTSCDPDDIPCIVACQSLPWEDKAEQGFIMKQRIKSYGQF